MGLALALIGLPGTGGDRLAFEPAPDLGLRKSFETRLRFRLDELRYEHDGDEEDYGGIEFEATLTASAKLVEAYLESGEGRPLELRRIYERVREELEIDLGVGDDTEHLLGEGVSRLEGRTLLWTWDDKREEYERELVKSEEPRFELPADLREDMDLRALLPEGPVEEGATWKLDAAVLNTLLVPGGDLGIDIRIDDDPTFAGFSILELFDFEHVLSDELEGRGHAEYLGVLDEGGRKLARIAIQFEVWPDSWTGERVAEVLWEDRPPSRTASFDPVELDYSFEALGELRWDLQAGHLSSFELQGEYTLELRLGVQSSMSSWILAGSGEIVQTIETE